MAKVQNCTSEMNEMMERNFAIVHFTNTNEVAVVPFKWVKGDECAWPPFKSHEKVIKYTKQMLDVDEKSWTFFPARIFETYDTYDEARKKLRKSENSSDLNTDREDVGRGKRKKMKRLQFTSSSEESEGETCSGTSRFTKSIIDKLPSPPTRLSPPQSQRSCSSHAQLSRPNHSPREGIYEETHLKSFHLGNPTECGEKEFRKEVLRQLALLRATTNNNRDMLESILNYQNQNSDNQRSNQQHDEINFDPAQLPMKTEESLLKIEEELKDNYSKNNMVNYLSKIGGNSINDMTKRIMRRLIGDELAKDYSWFGAKGKKQFSILQSARVLEEAVKRGFPEATEKMIEEATKNWLRHAPERLTGKQKRSL